MFLLHWAGEGTRRKNGLNFYPPSEWKHSIGFVLKMGRRMWWVRYSGHLKKMVFSYKKARRLYLHY